MYVRSMGMEKESRGETLGNEHLLNPPNMPGGPLDTLLGS